MGSFFGFASLQPGSRSIHPVGHLGLRRDGHPTSAIGNCLRMAPRRRCSPAWEVSECPPEPARRDLGRLPLLPGRRLLDRRLPGLLALDRHQHFLLAGRRLLGLLCRLRRSPRCRLRAADTFAQRVHQVDHVFTARTFLSGDRFPGALLVDQIDQRGFVLIFELVRLKVTRLL
jgi:hypothetical protein